MPLIQQQNPGNMNEQEMVALQEALLAQLGENEELQWEDMENEGQEGGVMNMINQLWGNWGANQDNEEDKNPN